MLQLYSLLSLQINTLVNELLYYYKITYWKLDNVTKWGNKIYCKLLLACFHTYVHAMYTNKTIIITEFTLSDFLTVAYQNAVNIKDR
jgi:hypothetical protein